MITEQEWNSIRSAAEKISAEISGRRVEWFQTAKVVKRDERNRLVYVQGMGDVAIPIVSFEFDVRIHDVDRKGNPVIRKARADLVVPRVGQTVLVGFELGISRLPRCLGVVLGTNWMEAEGD